VTFKENIVMRLIGLFIFFAPNAGSRFLADVTLGVNAKLLDDREAA
jgi:hypothetical protein